MDTNANTLTCAAMLFDLDGVLVDSTACVEHTWRQWAGRHGLDPNAVAHYVHGRRAVETVKYWLPQLNEAELAAEVATLVAEESHETNGLREVPGALDLLRALPPKRWAIVTSGVRAVAEHRLRFVRIPIPPIMICADEVVHGKPHPEGYLTAASRLGIAPAQCVVVEDAPAGLAAARAGGMHSVAVATTHEPTELGVATMIAPALNAITVRVERHDDAETLHVGLRSGS